MGSVISSIIESPEEIAEEIAGSVTDVGKCVAQLKDLIAQFSKQLLNSDLEISAEKPAIVFLRDDVQDVLADLIKKAASVASSTYTSIYSGKNPAGTNSGVVKDFCDTGDITPIKQTLHDSLYRWDLPCWDEVVNDIAAAIKSQVTAQMGEVGSTYGQSILGPNQSLDWTVSYGLFVIDPTQKSNGLVYGFSAGLDKRGGNQVSDIIEKFKPQGLTRQAKLSRLKIFDQKLGRLVAKSPEGIYVDSPDSTECLFVVINAQFEIGTKDFNDNHRYSISSGSEVSVAQIEHTAHVYLNGDHLDIFHRREQLLTPNAVGQLNNIRVASMAPHGGAVGQATTGNIVYDPQTVYPSTVIAQDFQVAAGVQLVQNKPIYTIQAVGMPHIPAGLFSYWGNAGNLYFFMQ